MFGVLNISILAVVFLICLAIAAVIVFFVSKDAKKRNMNPLLWALLAAFAPFFLGLILYMICRNPITELQCPNCGTAIENGVSSCPNCGNLLLTQCPNCEFPVQRGWENCPKCGNQLPKDFGQPVKEYKKEGRALAIMGIVVALMIASVLFVMISILSFKGLGNYSSESYDGYEGMYNITAEDVSGNVAIASWVKDCDASKKDIHVLVSEESKTCLVYIKNSNMLLESDLSVEYISNGSGDTCEIIFFIEESMYEDKYGYDFFLYEMEVYDDMTFDVFVNGEYQKDVTVTKTDADISWETWGGQDNE